VKAPRALLSIAVLLATVLVLLCVGDIASGPPTQPVSSVYEISTGRSIDRDCGYSVAVPGKPGRSLWLFCDTVIISRHGQDVGLILGTGTAAEGSYTAGRGPGALTEVQKPGAGGASPGANALGETAAADPPQPFLPLPAGLTLPASDLPCTGPDAYPARWFTGAAREPGPAGHLLISYLDYCVSGGGFTPEAFGLFDYDPARNVLGGPAQVFAAPAGQSLPSQWQFGSPIFRGGHLYLFGSCAPQGRCGRPGVFLARTVAIPAGWRDGYTYQYWTGRAWSSDPAQVASLLGPASAAAIGPLAVSVGDYSASGHGLVLIEETSVAGDFIVWQAASPRGQWRKIGTGRVPCTAGTQEGASALCRALIGHPEMSTATSLLMSFFNPGTSHVEISAYGW
jgi:hypothetical protein